MKLVPDWKDAYKWWSVQLAALIGGLNLAWETLPPEALAIIPVDWRGWITFGLAVAMVIVRIIKQGTAQDGPQ